MESYVQKMRKEKKMALIDDVKNEIMQARKAPAPAEEKRPEKKKRPKTKEEIAAFVARKQAEEERRYLKLQVEKADRVNPETPQKTRKPKVVKTPEPIKREVRKKDPKKAKGSCSKARPKTIKTIDLPDGGSLLIIYMPGPS